MCRALRVSRSGYYAWKGRPESKHALHDKQLAVLVRAAYDESRRYYGSPRVHRELRNHDVRVSRKRVIRLMQSQGLIARKPKRFKCTTVSDPKNPVAPNLLGRDFSAPAPNQRWVSDTTELVIAGSAKLYLAVVLDLFSRFVVGWAVSPNNDRHLTLRALENAIKLRCPEAGLLHHSDQGSPYTCEDYRDALAGRGVTVSMSRRGNCFDNAAMESWFSTLKMELGEHFATFGEAKEQLFDYIEVFYNQKRMHSALDYKSPAEYEKEARGALKLVA